MRSKIPVRCLPRPRLPPHSQQLQLSRVQEASHLQWPRLPGMPQSRSLMHGHLQAVWLGALWGDSPPVLPLCLPRAPWEARRPPGCPQMQNLLGFLSPLLTYSLQPAHLQLCPPQPTQGTHAEPGRLWEVSATYELSHTVTSSQGDW